MRSRTRKLPEERSVSASAAKLRLLKKLRCTLRYEKRAWELGAARVAGVDEVGRGSLFGPVVAAAVILYYVAPEEGLLSWMSLWCLSPALLVTLLGAVLPQRVQTPAFCAGAMAPLLLGLIVYAFATAGKPDALTLGLTFLGLPIAQFLLLPVCLWSGAWVSSEDRNRDLGNRDGWLR